MSLKRELTALDPNLAPRPPKRYCKDCIDAGKHKDDKEDAKTKKELTKDGYKYTKATAVDKLDDVGVKWVTFCMPKEMLGKKKSKKTDDNDDEEEEESENDDSDDEDEGGAKEKPAEEKTGEAEKKASEPERGDNGHIIVQKGRCRAGGCMCEKLLEHDHTWPYFVTKEGWNKFMDINRQITKRDQDSFSIHFYEDFSGYGVNEVVINTLEAFNKTLFNGDVLPSKKWANVEALALMLEYSDIWRWFNFDDADALADVRTMIGTMVLTAFDMLDEHGLFEKVSPVKNIDVIASFLLNWIWQNSEHDQNGDVSWDIPIVREMDKHQIPIRCDLLPYVRVENIEETRGQIEDRKEAHEKAQAAKRWSPKDDYDENEMRQWNRWDWKKEWPIFHKNHKGGKHYDITAMPKHELLRGFLEDEQEFAQTVLTDPQSLSDQIDRTRYRLN